jgi:hypothetical protein
VDPIIGEIIKLGAGTGPLATLGDAWQAIIGDRVAQWRLKNAMQLQIRANEEARRLGLALNTARIPERYAFAWFEEATKQDEPELQDLFARLLARAAAGDKDAQDRQLIAVLSQFTPIDAAIFQRIYSEEPFPDTGIYSATRSINHPMTGDPRLIGWPRDWTAALLKNFYGEDCTKSVEHLIICGVLGVGFYTEGHPNASLTLPPLAERKGISTGHTWREYIRAHSATRPYLLPTEVGTSLYRAVGTATDRQGEGRQHG